MTDCSYCNEPLQEKEIDFYNLDIMSIPLCTQCIINNT